MTFTKPFATALLGTIALGISLAAPAKQTSKVIFNRDIRPSLSDTCFACHGFDAKTRKAGLRLDVPHGDGGALMPNKDGRFAIKPGDPAASDMWQRIISTVEDDVMPPPDSTPTPRKRLPAS